MVDAQLQSLGSPAMQAAEAYRRRRKLRPSRGQVRPGRQGAGKARNPAHREEGSQDPRREAQAGRQADGRRRPWPDERRRDRDGRRGPGRRVQSKFKKATKTHRETDQGSRGSESEIKQLLDGRSEALDESKASECNSQFTMRVRKPEKSTSPSTNWGASTSGNVLGDKTKAPGQPEGRGDHWQPG